MHHHNNKNNNKKIILLVYQNNDNNSEGSFQINYITYNITATILYSLQFISKLIIIA